MTIERVRIIGPGRAGMSFTDALTAAGLWVELMPRSAPIQTAAAGVDVLLLCVPDGAIATVAAQVAPGDAVVMHCSGATGLDALQPHERVASVHPLMALPDRTIGAERIANGGWFAIAGDLAAQTLVDRVGGRHFEVSDDDRARYHAAAAIAANHLVALLGQVERLAESVNVPFHAFVDLAQGSMDDVRAWGAAAALTGPASRNDQGTLGAHRKALSGDDVELYDALAKAAATLANVRDGTATGDGAAAE